MWLFAPIFVYLNLEGVALMCPDRNRWQQHVCTPSEVQCCASYNYPLCLPLFCCMSCDPPVKDSCWAGVIVLWCKAESEFVLERRPEKWIFIVSREKEASIQINGTNSGKPEHSALKKPYSIHGTHLAQFPHETINSRNKFIQVWRAIASTMGWRLSTTG